MAIFRVWDGKKYVAPGEQYRQIEQAHPPTNAQEPPEIVVGCTGKTQEELAAQKAWQGTQAGQRTLSQLDDLAAKMQQATGVPVRVQRVKTLYNGNTGEVLRHYITKG